MTCMAHSSVIAWIGTCYSAAGFVFFYYYITYSITVYHMISYTKTHVPVSFIAGLGHSDGHNQIVPCVLNLSFPYIEMI